MSVWREVLACLTLGLLVGWYFFIMFVYLVLIYFSIFECFLGPIFKQICRGTIVVLITLSIAPINPEKHSNGLIYGFWFRLWKEYHDFTWDVETTLKKVKGVPHVYFEFPHGVYPMGQWLSVSIIREISEVMIYGLAADVIFCFPIMRQLMASVGTWPASKKNISKIFKGGYDLGIQVGGIAEMYLMNESSEKIYLKKRKGTVKVAIKEGAHIIPTFFFGNTRLFKCPGNNEGGNSWLEKISRKMRASILFFYGRFGLTIPYRHPLKFVTGEIVQVKQNDDPSDAEIEEVLEKVIKSLQEAYDTKKPDWETRPLIVT